MHPRTWSAPWFRRCSCRSRMLPNWTRKKRIAVGAGAAALRHAVAVEAQFRPVRIRIRRFAARYSDLRGEAQRREAAGQSRELTVRKFIGERSLRRIFFVGGPAQRETHCLGPQPQAVRGFAAAQQAVGRVLEFAQALKQLQLAGSAAGCRRRGGGSRLGGSAIVGKQDTWPRMRRRAGLCRRNFQAVIGIDAGLHESG